MGCRKRKLKSIRYHRGFLLIASFSIWVTACFTEQDGRFENHVSASDHEASNSTADDGGDDSNLQDSETESTTPSEQTDSGWSTDIETLETVSELSDTCYDTDCSTDPHFCYTLSVEECEDNDCILEPASRVDENAKCIESTVIYICREPALCTQAEDCMYSPDGELFEFSQGCNMKAWTHQLGGDCISYRSCDSDDTDTTVHRVK